MLMFEMSTCGFIPCFVGFFPKFFKVGIFFSFGVLSFLFKIIFHWFEKNNEKLKIKKLKSTSEINIIGKMLMKKLGGLNQDPK
jgi:hypothetical protein